MSTQEKSVHLKNCLKTIGVYSPELTRFIKRSIELDIKCKAVIARGEAIDRDLERMQAKLMVLLLTP